jgi:hypothetical protein
VGTEVCGSPFSVRRLRFGVRSRFAVRRSPFGFGFGVWSLENLARAQGQTMTELINEFIAEGLAARTSPKSEQSLNPPAFDMGRPRVNLADREALEAIVE